MIVNVYQSIKQKQSCAKHGWTPKSSMGWPFSGAIGSSAGLDHSWGGQKKGSLGLVKCDIYIIIYLYVGPCYMSKEICVYIYILNRYIYICVCSLKPSLAIDFYQRWVSNNGSVLLKITKDGGQNDVERF
jgi:hypothetical protein